MIVCSCNAFNDQSIRSLVTSAARPPSMSEVYRGLGCSAKCGRCTPTVKQIMDETLGCPRTVHNACPADA